MVDDGTPLFLLLFVSIPEETRSIFREFLVQLVICAARLQQAHLVVSPPKNLAVIPLGTKHAFWSSISTDNELITKAIDVF